ncbi:transposase [Stappia sp. P2PMeth1]|uniref:IS110 family transposase n=1 Tax=Stappia sp. P2PMeth1 TaxID=2003586 RepID=UPI0016455A39|nr:transposase [Stappia sp. P2PMeth1]
MKYFAGLDVSNKETAICIMDYEGKITKEGMVSTDPSCIREFLQSSDVSFEKIGLEAGNLSVWLYWDLFHSGYNVSCIDARRTSAIINLQAVKSDRNDARAIAHLMRTNLFTPVHVKSDESQRIRMLLNNRRCLVDQRVVLENQIRGTLKVFGLKAGEVTTARYDGRIRELIKGDGEFELAVEPLLEVRTLLLKKFGN